MKVAFVHDYLNQWGGAERVLDALHEIYPDAPVYTLMYDAERTRNHFSSWDIRTSFLQQPWIAKLRKYTLPFNPLAVESFNLSGFDVVISSSSGPGKGVITQPGTLHISYCHTPTLYLWSRTESYIKEQRLGKATEYIVRYILHKQRIWDRLAAERVDVWVANAENVRTRIKKYYRKDSAVIYPPVDRQRFSISKARNPYFLYISRLSGYKRPELVVDAFTKLKLPLVVIGEGDELLRLKSAGGPNITFTGWLPDKQVAEYMAKARALVFPVEEDFGIVPVESMAAGTPVIALSRGGALETIVEGITGLFFHQQTADSLISALRQFERLEHKFDPLKIRRHTERFDRKIFLDNMKRLVEKSYIEYKEKLGQQTK